MILTKKGKLSTSKESLMEMDSTDFIKKLLRYREIKKVSSTYLKPILENLDLYDRLHSQFNQAITVTGRLSSSNPINLQNIPSRTELGKQVRSLFIPDKQHKLLCLDFSQIELRLIAHFSQDQNMLTAYQKGVDIHEQTAKAIFEKDKPTKEERFIGKTINFSSSYGAGPKRIAQTINLSGLSKKVTEEEARVLLERFNALYPGINTWKRGVWWYSRKAQSIKTLLGRIIPIIWGKSWKDVARAEREAISYLVQGSAADIMKESIIKVYNTFPELRIISTVHDELLIEIDNKEELSNPIKDIMENVVTISIPLEVDAKIINSWGEK